MANTIKIENCPLIAFLRNGNMISFQHNAEVDNTKLFLHDLTGESVAEISNKLFANGYDAEYISIDESRIRYVTAEEMGW